MKRGGEPEEVARAILFLEEPGRLKGLTADQLGRLKNDGIRLLRLPSIVELSQHDGMALTPEPKIESVDGLLNPEEHVVIRPTGCEVLSAGSDWRLHIVA